MSVSNNANVDGAYLNRIFFERQIIFSINIEKTYPELSQLIKSGIAYEDHFTKVYFIPVSKDDPAYPDIRRRASKYNIKINESSSTAWLSFPEPHSSNTELKSALKGKRIDQMELAIMYPATVIKDGKMYHLVQYSSSIEQDMSDRILKLSSSFNTILGSGSMTIEEVSSNVKDVPSFLKSWGNIPQMVELTVNFPFDGGNIAAILASSSIEPFSMRFILSHDGNLSTASIDVLQDMIPGTTVPLKNIFSQAKENVGFSAYMEARCTGGRCTVNMILEERLFGAIATVLSRLIDSGIGITLERYYRI